MIRIQKSSIFFLFSFLMASATCVAAPQIGAGAPPLLLREGWAIQSSADVHEKGNAISTPGYQARDWYPATMPSTVLSALVKNRVYPDPYTDMNLRSIPGTTYPVFTNFSEVPMPPGSPFRNSWWFR